MSTEMTTTAGSSPLARGLPHCPRGGVLDQGIIPARAGFTRSRTRRSRRWTDHPRSRGVYRCWRKWVARTGGSSPLARGLPGHLLVVAAEDGIIPARAGFTGRRVGGRLGRRDHPRSRGVYAWAPTWSPLTGGSSPLARGLLPNIREMIQSVGIIPARAGFTWPVRGRGPPGPDHPRSRGVYGQGQRSTRTGQGSSPLARGLLVGGSGMSITGRIIPARAGFTVPPRRNSRWRRDHPRSRGVYQSPKSQSAGTYGSSPLARGLPTRSPPPALCSRIIPARAGFTTPW